MQKTGLTDLYRIVKKHIPEATVQQSKELVRDIFYEIEMSLLRREDVVLKEFGTFTVVPMPKRTVRNFLGRGKDVVIPECDKVYFKTSRVFKNELNGR